MTSGKSYLKHFPHDEIREPQVTAIDAALSAYKSGKRFVIIEAGTGVGKSAIGLTIARELNDEYIYSEDYAQGSWFVTTQKILQDQYITDYGPPSVSYTHLTLPTIYSV